MTWYTDSVPFFLSASVWPPPLTSTRVKTVGRVSAYEAADDGLNMTWAPMVDVSRDPRWGRASEGFGEDTYLTATMGKTMVEAMQGKSRRIVIRS
ncbi:glycoside hydrolase [Enterobacter cloacae]|uniref:beta-glucosidase n=1 Tax=Enterobacter cloacae TaxID=550 RepID=A0A377LW64_ENTCL|nr:glycoside hydrolase [Enterobacter cloacae]